MQFKDLFAPFIQTETLSVAFDDAEILGIIYNRHENHLTIKVRLSRLVRREVLYQLEETIRNSALDPYRVKITPEFPSELFKPEYYSELVIELKRQTPSYNGSLTGSEITVNGNRLTVNLKHGGKAILQHKGFDKALRKIIQDEFHLDFTVDFDGVLEVDSVQPMSISKRENAMEKEIRENVVTKMEDYDSAMETAKNKPTRQKAEKTEKTIEIRHDASLYPQLVTGSYQSVYGTISKDKPVPIKELTQELGMTNIWGRIFDMENRITKDGKYSITNYKITDYTGSVIVKVFDKTKNAEPLKDIKKDDVIVVKGIIEYDNYIKDTIFSAKAISRAELAEVVDNAERKRVELHLHTNMSSMDGVTPAGELVKRASKWGHTAIAITDHGVAQAFPEAMNTAEKINGIAFNEKKQKKFYGFEPYDEGEEPIPEKIKVIYGTEAYFVNDMISSVKGDTQRELLGEYICFDIETTGLHHNTDRITEIGAVRVRNGKIEDTFSTFVNPQMPIPKKITELTGITDDMVKDAPCEENAVREFLNFCGENAVLVAHNADFDTTFIRNACQRHNITYNYTSLDTLAIAKSILRDSKDFKLNTVAEYLRLGTFNHHRATDDATMLAKIFICFIDRLKTDYNITQLQEINTNITGANPTKLRPYHQIILVKNRTGLKNLYKLISMAHMKYFYRTPRIPKSELIKYRDGLLIGSACEAGELFRAIVEDKAWNELLEIASFYDYLEIQPIANNRFMLENGTVQTEKDLQDFNRKVIKIADTLGKPVVATCDVHFMDPYESDYRKILMTSKGFSDADNQAA